MGLSGPDGSVHACRECRECSPGVHPGAHLGGNTPTTAELGDLDGHDPGLGLVVVVNASHSSTSRAVAQEADDFDDLAYFGKIHAGVLVELVNRVRVLHREPDVVVTRHASTMARSHRLPRSREPDPTAELDPQTARETRLPAKAQLLRLDRPRPRPTPWANIDGGVLARLVRHAHAYDDPGAGSPVQEVTRHEDLIGEPILPMTIGVPDREVARHLQQACPVLASPDRTRLGQFQCSARRADDLHELAGVVTTRTAGSLLGHRQSTHVLGRLRLTQQQPRQRIHLVNS